MTDIIGLIERLQGFRCRFTSLLRSRQAARLCGYSPAYFLRLARREGVRPRVKARSAYYFHRDDLEGLKRPRRRRHA